MADCSRGQLPPCSDRALFALIHRLSQAVAVEGPVHVPLKNLTVTAHAHISGLLGRTARRSLVVPDEVGASSWQCSAVRVDLILRKRCSRTDGALAAAVAEMCVAGTSTRRFERVAEKIGVGSRGKGSHSKGGCSPRTPQVLTQPSSTVCPKRLSESLPISVIFVHLGQYLARFWQFD